MTNVKRQSNRRLSVVLIAAGNSSRLGQAKQLVQYNQQSLLQNSLNLAQHVNQNIICILGAKSEQIKKHINLKDVNIIENSNWKKGMGSSIAIGVKNLPLDCSAVMILLCDQYLLTIQDLNSLVSHWRENPKKLIAAEYFEKKSNSITVGAPAIFPKAYFPELEKLEEKGAKGLLQKNQSQLISVKMSNAAADLDTPEDLAELISYQQPPMTIKEINTPHTMNNRRAAI